MQFIKNPQMQKQQHRKVIAIFEIVEPEEHKNTDDGPLDYFKDGVTAARSEGLSYYDGITLENAVLCDEDDDELWDQYHIYLAQWIMDNNGIDCKGSSPLTYEAWKGRANGLTFSEGFDDFLNHVVSEKTDVCAVSISGACAAVKCFMTVEPYGPCTISPNNCFLNDFFSTPGDEPLCEFIDRFPAHKMEFGELAAAEANALYYMRDYVCSPDICSGYITLRNTQELKQLFGVSDGIYLVSVPK